MRSEEIEALAARAEGGSTTDPAFVQAMLAGLAAALPEAKGQVDARVLVSPEAALALVDAVLPGWRISLERNGRWRCTLRETSARDDDELIGVSKAATVPIALMAALLRVAERRARGYR